MKLDESVYKYTGEQFDLNKELEADKIAAQIEATNKEIAAKKAAEAAVKAELAKKEAAKK